MNIENIGASVVQGNENSMNKLRGEVSKLTTQLFEQFSETYQFVIAKRDDKKEDHPPYCFLVDRDYLEYVDGEDQVANKYTYRIDTGQLTVNGQVKEADEVKKFFSVALMAFDDLENDEAILLAENMDGQKPLKDLVNEIISFLPEKSSSVIFTNFKKKELNYLTCQITSEELRLVEAKQTIKNRWVYKYEQCVLARNDRSVSGIDSVTFSNYVGKIIQDIKANNVTIYEEKEEKQVVSTTDVDDHLKAMEERRPNINIVQLSPEELKKITGGHVAAVNMQSVMHASLNQLDLPSSTTNVRESQSQVKIDLDTGVLENRTQDFSGKGTVLSLLREVGHLTRSITVESPVKHLEVSKEEGLVSSTPTAEVTAKTTPLEARPVATRSLNLLGKRNFSQISKGTKVWNGCKSFFRGLKTLVVGALMIAAAPIVGIGAGIKAIVNKVRGTSTSPITHLRASPERLQELRETMGENFPSSISDKALDKMEELRSLYNPEVSTDEMMGFMVRGSDIFKELQSADGNPDPPRHEDVLSVSWFTSACAAEKDQAVISGSLRMDDPDGRIHDYLQSYKDHTLSESGDLQASPEPYRRISSHYGETSTSQRTDMMGHKHQFAIESYQDRPMFPGGKKCFLWDQLRSPGASGTEVFFKFEEAGMPDLLDGWNVKGLGVMKKIGQFYRNMGVNIKHCSNFGSGRGATGNVDQTTWKEHIKTNKPLTKSFEKALKGLKETEGIPKEIKDDVDRVLSFKEYGFDTMMTALYELSEKLSQAKPTGDVAADSFREKMETVREEFRGVIGEYYDWLDQQGHDVAENGLMRKGNEVHVDPFSASR
jgi:hypothetical protein